MEINKRAAWKTMIVRTLLWLLFGGTLAVFMGTGGAILWFVVEALLIWRLVAALSKPLLYGLVVNTDVITQYGPGSIGKARHTGSGTETAPE
ncbi:hypothetical protein [Streptomyces sp. Je 1-369]|uniref:hypothetical protein n=1 Tax=Streptomyces sp. Je 1-369 TaxID=2966192 RepID=UPI002285CAC0|nr:hypothetical protein [Streptomyces sp. Je 1-369]WAL93537.1 hypothetical protein NOO62_02970 [Streptomyces sp. Je 1-369]